MIAGRWDEDLRCRTPRVLHCSQAPLGSACNTALKTTKQSWGCCSAAFAAVQARLLKNRNKSDKVQTSENQGALR